MNQSFFARRSFLIMLGVVFLLPLILAGTRRALDSNRNDVKDWLPADFPETKTHRWFQDHFPHEQFALVSWERCTLEDERLEWLALKLENHDPDLEELGITGKLAKKLEAKRLNSLRSIERYGDLESIDGIGPEQAAQVAGAIKAWVSPFKQPVLTGERLVKQMQLRHPELTEKQVLKRLEGSLIGKDHEKTCLVVTLSDAAKGKNLRATLETIRQIAEDECAIPRDQIHMGGPPVDNVAIDVEGEKTLYRLAALSAVVGLGISWLCFRSFRLTFLVFSCGLLAAGVGLASVYFTGRVTTLLGLESISSTYGTVDAILLSMPSLVYVLAISGAVHIVNYYHDAVREHGLGRAPERALAHGMIPCALAAITTALGLGSLMASHLVPINKFGIYSAWGVLATLGLLFLFLPACLHYWPSRDYLKGGKKDYARQPESPVLVRFWHAVGKFVIGHNVLVGAGCLAVMAVFMVGLTRVNTSVKLMKLFSPNAQIIHDYRWLEEQIGPLVPMEVVIRVDNQKCRLNIIQRMRMARDVEHAIENQLDDVGGVLSAATFAPPIGKTPTNAKIRLGFSTVEGATSRVLQRSRDRFRQYLAIDGEATLKELGITGKLAKRLDAHKLDTLKAIRQHHDLASIKGVGPQGAVEVNEAIDQWLAAHGEELWRVSARVWALTDLDYSVFVHTLKEKVEKVLDQNYRVLSQEDLASGAEPVEGIEVTYTGLVPLVYKAQHELLSGLFNSLKWAFVLIALVMIIVLRSPSAGLLSMIPNIFPVVLIFGAMGWLGILIDVGSMMTASVALGVAVDDTIHFLTWFRRGLDEGRDRKGAVMLAYERCGTAMSQTTLIGGLGLAVFAFSTFTPTQRFGYLMLALLAAALVGDLIFLPAVLSGPIGRVFRTGKKKSPDESPQDEESEAELRDDEVVAVPSAGRRAARFVRRDSSHRSTRVS